MNPLSSDLPFHVHNWLIISLKDFCNVIRKWPTFWPSNCKLQIYAISIEFAIFYKQICVHGYD